MNLVPNFWDPISRDLSSVAGAEQTAQNVGKLAGQFVAHVGLHPNDAQRAAAATHQAAQDHASTFRLVAVVVGSTALLGFAWWMARRRGAA